MSSLAMIIAVASSHMTFICTPPDDERRTSPYVISLEKNGDRIRHVWVIWPDGSQSRDRWKGRASNEGLVLSAGARMTTRQLTIKLDNKNAEQATLDDYWAVTGGHVPMQGGEDNISCSVRIAENVDQ